VWTKARFSSLTCNHCELRAKITQLDTLQEFLQIFVQGLKLGSIYALIALGYTMVYGVLKLINFAHGEVFMLGGMLSIYYANWLGFDKHPSWLALVAILVLAMVSCGLIGGLIERVAYRPLRDAPRLSLLITAIGVSLLIQNLCQLPMVFGPTPKSFPMLIENKPLVSIGNLNFSTIELLVLALSFLLMVTLHLVVNHSRLGLAMRAVSFNHQTAGLMGIHVNRVVAFTFVLGSALAGAAGVLVGLSYPSMDPMIGLPYGIKAFVAAVLGGIGNIPGALLGGLLLGQAETVVASKISSMYKDAVAFLILILVLLVKPGGLMGRRVIEKV
jgi:branched-chain amino acid transport system permease protein